MDLCAGLEFEFLEPDINGMSAFGQNSVGKPPTSGRAHSPTQHGTRSVSGGGAFADTRPLRLPW